MTLLDKAFQVTPRKTTQAFSPEEIELAVAWANSEVSLTQVQAAMNKPTLSGCYSFLSRALRQYIRQGGKTGEVAR